MLRIKSLITSHESRAKWSGYYLSIDWKDVVLILENLVVKNIENQTINQLAYLLFCDYSTVFNAVNQRFKYDRIARYN